MYAYFVDAYKKGSLLRLREAPEPDVGPNDVLVQVHAVSLNLLDSKIRDGEFKPILPYKPPFIAGHDVAGTVLRVGAQVRKFNVGDEVYSRPSDGRIGTFAERIAIDQKDLALKPKTLSFAEAASVPLVGLTAWQALVDRANLRSGQKVFIQAGSGGVGTFAIQLAKHLGAKVATTTSAANGELVRNLGADVVIDYREQDFEKVLLGYDVVLNSQDTETLEKSLRVVRRGGVVVSISGPPDPGFAKQKRLNPIIGLVFRLLSRGIRKKAQPAGIRYTFLFMNGSGAQLEQITKLIEAGAIRPVIDKVFAFEALNEAMAYLETGRAKGKVVVTLR
ncbi:NADPH:quinone oxidoreductase [Devosia sp. Leaf420]|uniref:NADP-dependent oxidoreductase n=1 Tax=Devosia sp. Leaf420 TaxID=1736374 RepID=UPI000715DF72|nr:NADP-dependent oxidoreductase [Devosia sp. Leaf420]KQT44177.1 NADPH:quinone oxidoreductase [Devosia sp. Leaf420]